MPPSSLRIWPNIAFLLYLGMKTTWYLHSHRLRLRLSTRLMSAFLLCCLAAHKREFLHETPGIVKLLVPPRQSRGVSHFFLARYPEFDGETLQRAIRATFDRRRTELPSGVPFGLTDEFAQDTQKQTQWQAFLGKNRLQALQLDVLVAALRDLLLPPIAAANAGNRFPQLWPAGGPWTPEAP